MHTVTFLQDLAVVMIVAGLVTDAVTLALVHQNLLPRPNRLA